MHLSVIQWIPIFATVLLQMVILAVLVRRKLRSSFPFFFNFVALSLISISVRAALFSWLSPSECFYLRWTLLGLATLLSFAVMHELFVHILRPYSALVDLGKLLFRWAIAFLILVSLVTAVATSEPDTTKVFATIEALARCSQFIQCGLLLLFVLFQGRLGLSWRSPAICVMLGFGINATVALASSFFFSRFPSWSSALSWAGPLTCVAVYAGWLSAFMLPQPQRRTVQDSPTRLIFQRWNEALMATPLVSRKHQIAMSPIESFLPGVEQTVERVMARKMMH